MLVGAVPRFLSDFCLNLPYVAALECEFRLGQSPKNLCKIKQLSASAQKISKVGTGKLELRLKRIVLLEQSEAWFVTRVAGFGR